MANIQNQKQQLDLKIDKWLEQLQDQSLRNPLINLKLTSQSVLELESPTILDLYKSVIWEESRLKVRIEDLPINSSGQISDENQTPLIPTKLTTTKPGISTESSLSPDKQVTEPTQHTFQTSHRNVDRVPYNAKEIVPVPGAKVLQVLRNLQSRSKSATEEHGGQVLFLALGLLSWKETEDSPFLLAPLVLVPISISRESVLKPYQIKMTDDGVSINATLRSKLEQNFAIKLPDLPEEPGEHGLEQYLHTLRKNLSQAGSRFAAWAIQEKAVLAILNTPYQLMVNDIETNRPLIDKTPIFQLLTNREAVLNQGIIDLVNARDLDEQVSPETVFQILDADSSQQEVIEAAKKGMSFIVQGPPGTGKSQTIVNIIAEMIAQHKKVLFVSEKMAALEVVYKRLEKAGLSRYVLVVHSQRTDKKQLLTELKESLNTSQAHLGANELNIAQQLSDTRERLNAYIRALHKPYFGLKKSAWDAYGELTKYPNYSASLNFDIDDVESIRADAFAERKTILDRLDRFSAEIAQIETHPWKGVHITSLPLQEYTKIQGSLEILKQLEATVDGDFSRLASLYGLHRPQTLSEMRELVSLAKDFRPVIQDVAFDQWISSFEKATRTPSFLRSFGSGFKTLTTDWRSVRWSGDVANVDPKVALDGLHRVQTLYKSHRIDKKGNGIELVGKVESEITALISKLNIFVEDFNEALKRLRAIYAVDKLPVELEKIDILPAEVIAQWASRQLVAITRLEKWVNLNEVFEKATHVELKNFIQKALERDVNPEHWRDTYLHYFFARYVDAIVQRENALVDFRAEEHEDLIRQFQNADQTFIKAARQRIHARYFSAESKSNGLVTARTSEEMLLRTEVNKQRRHKSLRRIFNEIPNLITKLRPCLMMSPLTVSQLLQPEKYQFDLVIFDEASQIPMEHAVGALMRGKQHIIVGDRQQMPPTRFFETLNSDSDWDEDEPNAVESFESVLHELDVHLPTKSLLWHYRSKDESLIAFSNFHFYGKRLITFPSAFTEKQKSRFLEYIYVDDGIFVRGSTRANKQEAETVVKMMAAHLKSQPEMSLGVVTFSQSQQQMIEELWEQTLRRDPMLQAILAKEVEEPLFIKNLETVQGDEREVIFLSVGYGKDADGKLLMRFGPLNGEGGERRLNVAITRARSSVKLISSIQPEDIDITRISKLGVKLLRSYMMVARDGIGALYNELDIDEELQQQQLESPFEKSVYDVLRSKGLILKTQVGVSGYRIDLAVLDPQQPGRYLLGIECDGASYHSAATARERDRLRQQILERLGWRIHRIWSRNWVTRQEDEIRKVLQAIEDARSSQKHDPVSKIAQTVDVESDNVILPDRFSTEMSDAIPITTSTPIEAIPWITSYRLAELPAQSNNFQDASDELIFSVLQEVVKQEGPIHKDIAFRRVLGAWGIRRQGKKISERLESVFAHWMSLHPVNTRDDFLWPADLKTVLIRKAESEETQRDIEHIPVQEIKKYMLNITRDSLSLEEEDLIRGTAEFYGIKRISEERRRLLQTAVDESVMEQTLLRIDSRISVPK